MCHFFLLWGGGGGKGMLDFEPRGWSVLVEGRRGAGMYLVLVLVLACYMNIDCP